MAAPAGSGAVEAYSKTKTRKATPGVYVKDFVPKTSPRVMDEAALRDIASVKNTLEAAKHTDPFKSSTAKELPPGTYGGRKSRRRKTRRRGGAKSPAGWLNELHHDPSEETLNRVTREIRAFSGNRDLIASANQLLMALRLPLGSRETREQRLANIILRLSGELRALAPEWRPGANVRGLGNLAAVNKEGLPLPGDANKKIVGFLSPTGRDEDVGVALSRSAVAMGKPGVKGPAGGRRRTTRRR